MIGTLPAGKSITIWFDVRIDSPIYPDVVEVSNQGSVTGSGFAEMLTDDPDTAEALLEVRAVRRSDLDRVIDLDATVTGLEKRKYWLSVYRRYGSGQHDERKGHR